MSIYSKKDKVSDKIKDDAMKIARGTQRPGQTKEQTKLIAQGIEKGISEYKKQQKVKSRERDKQRKKTVAAKVKVESTDTLTSERVKPGSSANSARALLALPWLLLLASWGYFIFL